MRPRKLMQLMIVRDDIRSRDSQDAAAKNDRRERQWDYQGIAEHNFMVNSPF